MKHVVAIPTLNRPDDLSRTLKTIYSNKKLPDLLIIVDQSDDNKTRDIIKPLEAKYSIKYIRSDKKGLTHARNIAIENSLDFDIITFLDDDVDLEKDFLSEIENTYISYPEISGCQGFIKNTGGKLLRRSVLKIRKILSDNRLEYFKPPTINEYFLNSYPLFVKKNNILPCEWLSGCDMSYKINDIRDERFNEDFILYGMVDDVEFSYRLFSHGKKLVMNTNAKLVHRLSKTSRLPSTISLVMRFAYFRFLISEYRKDNVEELYYKYVNHIRDGFKNVRFKFLRKERIEQITAIVDDAIRKVEPFLQDIDKGNLRPINEFIISELSKIDSRDQVSK